MLAECQAWQKKSYPDFVWRRNPKPVLDFIPVFSSHEVQEDDFEAKLHFLKTNGYQTITADSLVDAIKGKISFPQKTVMISFDDGRQSVWTVAFPLLKKYGFQATLFLSPELMVDDSISKNLDDLWAKKRDGEALKRKRYPASLTWDEVKTMHASGVMDFQCHGLAHRKIPVQPQIVTFLSPNLVERYFFEFDVPVMSSMDAVYPFTGLLGAPIYVSKGFLGPMPMFLDDPAVRGICMDYVRNQGGEFFFQKKKWEKELRQVVHDFQKNQKSTPRFENSDQQKKRMFDNLNQSKQLIEKQLKNKTVQHLAYPWGEGSETAIACSKEAGYVSNFWATLPHLSKNKKDSDPFKLVRLKHDFIWRLPAQGRKSLSAIYKDKFFRRAQGRLDY